METWKPKGLSERNLCFSLSDPCISASWPKPSGSTGGEKMPVIIADHKPQAWDLNSKTNEKQGSRNIPTGERMFPHWGRGSLKPKSFPVWFPKTDGVS